MRRTALVLVLLFLFSTVSNGSTQHLQANQAVLSPANPTGVDVRVIDASVSYTDSVDESKYKMFSSNHPILGFDRPAELFVVDGMVNVSATITVGVENMGTNPSGTIDVNVRLLHDDYDYFEFSNRTVQMSALNGGASNTITVSVVDVAGKSTVVAVRTSSAQTESRVSLL